MKTITELKSFLTLWLSQSASSLGTAMTEYALTVWVYQQKGTAMSLTLLTLCTFLPTILLRFVAGALADRWDKMRIMLLSDAVAACGTLTILVLHRASALEAWHLYVINFLLSCMNAFQIPASYVAMSLLIPERHYAKAGSLQSASGAITSIAAPALGSLVYAASGLDAVLAIDLMTFGIAICSLLSVPIPKSPAPEKQASSFIQDCLFGFRYLKQHPFLLKLSLFLTTVNLLAKLGSDGMLAAFVLGRLENGQHVLGMVQACVPMGILVGSTIAAALKPPKGRSRLVFILCGLTFLTGNAIMPILPSYVEWGIALIASYACASAMGVHLGVIMRASVPIPVQGRVFSARSTLENCSIPLGLYLGGVLADRVFEPLMAYHIPAGTILHNIFVTGISLMFFIVGIMGTAFSLIFLLRKYPD